MKHVFVGGLGSIAQRHIRNLKALRPDAEVVTVDIANGADYDNILFAPIQDNCVYICTPFAYHSYNMRMAWLNGAIAIFCEKPLFPPSGSTYDDVNEWDKNIAIAVGYNYRFNFLFRTLKSRADGIAYLHFYGSEDLFPKYGATALGTMASHSIDAALWLLGDGTARVIDLGTCCMVGIRHTTKAASHIWAGMNSPFRVATLTVMYLSRDDMDAVFRGEKPSKDPRMEHYFVEPDDQMYVDEMRAWLNYVDTGDPGDLCTLDQALAVQRIMSGK